MQNALRVAMHWPLRNISMMDTFHFDTYMYNTTESKLLCHTYYSLLTKFSWRISAAFICSTCLTKLTTFSFKSLISESFSLQSTSLSLSWHLFGGKCEVIIYIWYDFQKVSFNVTEKLKENYLEDDAKLNRKFMISLASARERTWFHLPLPLNARSRSSASDNWDAMETRALEEVASMLSRAKILEFLAPGDIICGNSLQLRKSIKYSVNKATYYHGKNERKNISLN